MKISAKIRVCLMAGVALTGAVLSAVPASAAVMKASYIGNVLNNDNLTGEFGTLPGTDLRGLEALMVFEYDPSTPGVTDRTTTATTDTVVGGAAQGTTSPLISATITINGVARSIDPSFSGRMSADATNSNLDIQGIFVREFAGSSSSDNLSATVSAAPLALPSSLETAIPLTALDPTLATFPLGIGQFLFSDCIRIQISGCAYPGDYTSYVQGAVAFTSFKVESVGGPTDPPVIPLPAALPLLVTAFGGLGFVARRRQVRGWS